MKNKKVLFLTQAAMIAAVYVILTEMFAPISFSVGQVRIAEALLFFRHLHLQPFRDCLSAV